MNEYINLGFSWKLDEEFEGRAFPAVDLIINGHYLHLYALRIRDTDADGELRELQEAWDANFEEELERLVAVNGMCDFETHDLPGLEGDWIIVCHSHGR